MNAELLASARRDVLASYRRDRRRGSAPRTAARHVRDVTAAILADAVVDYASRKRTVAAARYRDARDLVAEVDSRADALPFWQTGKVTPPITHYAHIESDRGFQSDEVQSGECWTCEQGFMRRGNLIMHVTQTHGRRPFDAVPYTVSAS